MSHTRSLVRGSPRRDTMRTTIRGVGELSLPAGLGVLRFVFYEIYVTDWSSAVKQREVTAKLDDTWRNPRGFVDRPVDGAGLAKMYIPRFGPDFVFTVLEGTNQSTLEAGPGHYRDTALPGQPGNFAVAGHRVGKGSPVNSLYLLQACDAIWVETADHWFVYRVLPLRGELAGWAARKAARPQCQGVDPLPGLYSDVVGKVIVRPTQTEVIAPMPGHPGRPAKREIKLITLTTCHPQFSARQRLIVHGILVAQYRKTPGQRPAELTTEA